MIMRDLAENLPQLLQFTDQETEAQGGADNCQRSPTAVEQNSSVQVLESDCLEADPGSTWTWVTLGKSPHISET